MDARGADLIVRFGRRHAEGHRLYGEGRPAARRIAAEYGFLPYDAANVLRAAYPDADWVDALFVLERQRAKKSASSWRS